MPSYTEQEWAKKAADPEGNYALGEEMQAYADKKGVDRDHVGVRWRNGKSHYYVIPEHARNSVDKQMNFD